MQKLTVSRSCDTLSNGLRIINRNVDSPYYYKDIVGTDSLIGNYQIFYAENDTTYFLYLKHNDSLQLLNTTTNATSLHHLGVPVSDDTTFFILGHDNGNGSPYTYEYIDKKTGKNPLGFGEEFADSWLLNKNMHLLYSDTVIDDRTRLGLFNNANNKKEYFELADRYGELSIDTLTKNILVIKYSLDRDGDSTKRKRYRRLF